MKIVIDGRWLRVPLHGIARYTLNLIRHLPLGERDTLCVVYNRGDFVPEMLAQGLPGPALRQLVWVHAGIPLFSRGEPWGMSQLLRSLQPDLVHLPAYWKPFVVPSPWVMTVHDLIHLQQPSLKYRLYYGWLRQQLWQAARVLTVSHQTAQALGRWCGAEVAVTPLGVEPHFQPSRLGPQELDWLQQMGVRRPCFFWVGNPKPHKNSELALAAAQAVAAEAQLVTLGLPASGQQGHLALNAIAEAQLPVLYKGACALLATSELEGFGLPLVEAMACGTPVLAADTPIYREVLAEAGRFLPLQDVGAWQQALQQLLAEPAALESQRELGLERVQGFQWSKMAADSYRVYQQSVGQAPKLAVR